MLCVACCDVRKGEERMQVLKKEIDDVVVCNLNASRITVGRDASNDVVLDNVSVSGFHAVIFCEGDLYLVADLGSTNGSFINGQRINGRVEFTDGDKLQFGSVRFVVGDSKPRRLATLVMPVAQLETESCLASNASLRLVSGSGPVMLPVSRQLSVGRNEENDLVLDSSMVSGQHATVFLENGVAVVTDSGSTNGTFVNGQRITRAELHHGDRVRFDAIEYIFEMPTESAHQTVVRPAVSVVTTAIQINPSVGPEAILAKEDRLVKELGVPPGTQQATATTIQPVAEPCPNKPEAKGTENAASANTVVQPVAAIRVKPTISATDGQAASKTVVQPALAQTEDAEEDTPDFLQDRPNVNKASPTQQTDDSIGELFRMAMSDYLAWPVAIILALAGMWLQGLGNSLIQQSSSFSGAFLALVASAVLSYPAIAILLSIAAKRLGYGIDSAYGYGFQRFLPLTGCMIALTIAAAGVVLPFVIIGGIAAASMGSPVAAALLMIPGAFLSLYVMLRLWPMIVMAITERDAFAFREAWRLTGQSGAFMKSTLPLFGWMMLGTLLVIGTIAAGFAIGKAVGLAALVVIGSATAFVGMPFGYLLAVSRYMRLHTLSAG